MIQRMLAIWSLALLPFLKPAWTSESSWFTHCWSLAWRIFQWSCMDVRVGLWRKLSAEKLMLFWTVVLEKTLESPLDCKEIQPVPHKGNQPWVFIGRTDAEAETPILWPPHAESWFTGKDPDVGRDWGQEEETTTEDEMAGWHHRLNGHEFEQTLELVMDREAQRAAIHGVSKSWTGLSDWTELRVSSLVV